MYNGGCGKERDVRQLQVKVFAVWSVAFYASALVYAFEARGNVVAALAAFAVAAVCLVEVFRAAYR